MFSNIERFGNNIALICESGRSLSYDALAKEADELMQPLGLRPLLLGIECENNCETLIAYIGALRAGHAIILAGPGGFDETSALFMQFRPNYVFKRDQPKHSRFIKTSDETVDLHPELAVLLSTSGTTGSAKLVRLSNGNIAANAASIVNYLELSQADRAITCLPLQYSYGLSVVNSHLSCGASLILTDKSVTHPDFWQLFDRHQATNFQGVPHSFQLLQHSDFANRRHDSLRFFTQAGGKLPEALAISFGEYAQSRHVRFYVMYGQTEATARMAWLPPEDLLKYPDLIGRAIPDGAFHIESDGAAVPEGQSGELIYRGPNVMMGYALSREDLSLGKVTHELKTGDIAVKTASGYYKIIGRASRFLKLFGLRIGLDEVEARIRNMGYVNAATGSDEKLIIALEGKSVPVDIISYLENELGLPAHVYSLIVLEHLPRTYNGKIDYASIKHSSDQKAESRTPTLTMEAKALFGKKDFDSRKSFVELGGDSLSYVHFALAIEQKLGRLPKDWERIPLDKLEKMAVTTPQVSSVRHIPIDIVLRATAIMMVLINHVTLNNIDGSAMLLLALAGYSFGRFQIPQIANGKGLQVLRSLALNVLLPYYLTLIPIAILMGPENLPNLMMMYNFVPDHIRSELPITLIYFWYIESYIIIIASLTIALSLIPLRHFLKTHAWAIPLILFIALEVVRTLSEGHGDRGIFNPTSPLIVGSRFTAGWLLFSLPTQKLRILTAFALIPYVGFHPLSAFEHTWYILAPGLALLVLVNSVTFKGLSARYIAPLITIVAASSLYIYMEQFYVINIAEKLGTPLTIPVQIGAVLACLAVGISIQFTLNRINVFWTNRHAGVATGFGAT